MVMTASLRNSARSLVGGVSAPPNQKDMDMQKIKLLKSTVCGGKNVQCGEVVEASPKDAFYLLTTGAAVEYVEPVKTTRKTKAPSNKMVEEQELQNRDIS